MDSPEKNTAKGVYESLKTRRIPYLMRAWDCSELTIPAILPREGHTPSSELPTPFQSVGARGVNHLTSKLLMVLFPPHQPFFRQKLEEILVAKLEAEANEAFKTELEDGLAAQERAVMSEIAASSDRATAVEACNHLIIAGNVLWHQDPKNGARMFALNHYVVRRDPSGTVLEIVVHEMVEPDRLPEGAVVPKTNRITKGKPDAGSQPASTDKTADLYTRIIRHKDSWEVYQEAYGKKIPGTEGSYPLDKSPWIPLRFTRIDGEDYGRGYVENYLGDLRSLEALRRAMVEGTAAAAKVLFLVKPNGTTRAQVLAEAPNGAIRSGDADEVSVLHLDKGQDFAVAQKLEQEIKHDLELCFLLNSAIQRDAERVTAEEIRFMAQELESILGGFYSVLAQEFQLPYVKVRMHQMVKAGKLKPIPKNVVKLTIITGLDALGRGNEVNKLKAYIQDLRETVGDALVSKVIDVSELAARLAIGYGVDKKGLIKTREQIAADQKAETAAHAVENLGPSVIQAGGRLIEGAQTNNGE